MADLITVHSTLGTCIMAVENHYPRRTPSHLELMGEMCKMNGDAR